MVAELYKYTPALDKPESLQKLLVGRESLLKRLLQAIRDGSKSKSLQHFLLIGPRGIGKTHLLLLLYYSVKRSISWDKSFGALNKAWEPILFSEEQYGLGSLNDLLLAILERLNEQSSDEKLARLLTQMKDVWLPGEKERTAILDYLIARRNETGKRLLLLLDNLQLILHNFSEEDQSRLRGILMSQDLFMIVGSAPTLFDAVLNYEAPFYNFFEVIWLKEMSFEEVEALLKKRLELDNHTDIIKNFDEYRPRIRTIVHLTDGNPRLILSLYQILSQGEVLEVERALLRLLDELTPYFQDRMNGLSEQQRKVIEAMALMEGLSTPTEIAHSARLGVNVVTSQVRRLEKLGYVRRHRRRAKREALYDISEQLFRLWRQMRLEAGRRRLHFIVTFLKIWFTEQELTEFAKKIAQDMSMWLGQAKYEEVRESIDKLYYLQEAAPAHIQSEIHFRRVCGLIDMGDLAEAEHEIQERIKQVKTQKDKELLTQELSTVGIAYAEKGKHDRAIESFQKALKIKPDSYAAWNNLGNVYAKKGEYDKAIETYRKVLEVKADYYMAWNNLGIAHAKKREYDRAIEAFQKALEIKADGYETWGNLGNIHAKKGEYDRAIEAYQKILEIKADDYKAWYNLGNAYTYKRDYDRAIEAYQKALEIKSDDYGVWNNLGSVYTMKREYDKAIEANQKALEIKSNGYKTWGNLGNIHTNKGEYDQAIEVYQKALEIKSNDYVNWYNLGNVHLILSQNKACEGNEKQAIENYQRALDYMSQVPLDMVQIGLTLYFKGLFQAKAIGLVEKALDLIEVKGADWAELLRPYREALRYLKTKDETILDRLFPEIRQIVEQMVAQVEEETKE